MKVRVQKKIYKRADRKVKEFLNNDRKGKRLYSRSTYDIAKEEDILSGIEKKIFIKKQDEMIAFMNSIIEELKAEGKW